MGLPSGILGSWLVASIPAVFELIGAMAVLCISDGISLKLQAALQNFSAGIIIAAIGGSLFPLLEEKVQQSDSILLSVAGILLGFGAGLCLMFWIKSIGEEGPQYQEELVMEDLDDGEEFIGLDDDLDDIPLELAPEPANSSSPPVPTMSSGMTPKHSGREPMSVMTAGGMHGIAVKNVVVNKLRGNLGLVKTDSSTSTRSSVPPLSVGTGGQPSPAGLFPGTDLKQRGHLEGAESLPPHLRSKINDHESGSLPSGSLTERGRPRGGDAAALEHDANNGSVTERKVEPAAGMSTARQRENFEMQKHLAQRLLWAADLPAANMTEVEMAELNLEGLESDGLEKDGSLTARYREPLRTREASTESEAHRSGSGVTTLGMRGSARLEDLLSPTSQRRAGRELEEVEVMLDKMEFLLTLRFGFDGKPLLVLRKAADLLVRQLRASVDVNRRSLSREPDVISPGEQERMLEMIAAMRGAGGAAPAAVTPPPARAEQVAAPAAHVAH